ncbi:hypothetical protein [Nocardioides aurantiacus]|uniref:Peptidase MA superfamily protein n=1 Tax=Nocardioides aurantiacus TaxID=86796 RepID=A0A3N2CV12_9ACTN|nr:hypothetical protein [Nocardioides aurantiacus]ROR91329.1 hypothetical protein EDD33_2195 [Nocardioides aurantiacus]
MRRRSRARVAAVLLALLLPLTACSDDGPSQDVVGAPAAPSDPALTREQQRAQEQRILDQRARAVREGDLGLFLRRVDRSDPELVARQTRYFRNLVQLPLARFEYVVQDRDWDARLLPRWGRDAQVPQVRLRMQLQDFDTRPVDRTVGFVFAWRGDRARIVSDRDGTGRPLFDGAPAPWDLTSIRVRERPGVLGVFDTSTVDVAPTVMGAVSRGIGEVDATVPFTWPGQVVVYHVRDAAVLDSFTDVPGGSIDLLGAMTFPTYSQPTVSPVASTRMLVLEGSVAAGQPFLGRIVRHELTHVALGTRDDGAPVWLSEGLAEYVGARTIPIDQRIIPTSAVDRARSADAALPASREFNGPEQEWHYALSWMACDYLAAAQGEEVLWRLVEAMHDAGRGTTDDEQDAVLRRVVGMDAAELARRAAARIRNLYG